MIKKPYILFHGYKKFDKKVMPSIKHPLWTGNFNAAESYIGGYIDNQYYIGGTFGGLLILKPNQSKLKIVDINDEIIMTKAFGSIGKLISKSESFYYFFSDDLLNYATNDTTGKMSLQVLMSKLNFIKSDARPFIDFVIKFTKNKAQDSITIDKLTTELIIPVLYNLGFNCIAEHEDGDDNYMLISDEMLIGNCCKFLDKSQYINNTPEYKRIMKTLSNFDIYNSSSVNALSQLIKNTKQKAK